MFKPIQNKGKMVTRKEALIYTLCAGLPFGATLTCMGMQDEDEAPKITIEQGEQPKEHKEKELKLKESPDCDKFFIDEEYAQFPYAKVYGYVIQEEDPRNVKRFQREVVEEFNDCDEADVYKKVTPDLVTDRGLHRLRKIVPGKKVLLLVDVKGAKTKPEIRQLPDLTEKNYKKEVVDSDIPVVVEVHAWWCAPCKKLEMMIERNLMPKYDGKVGFAKIEHYGMNGEGDLGSEGRLRRKAIAKHTPADIDSYPALIFVDGGRVKHVHRGKIEEGELSDLIDKTFGL